MAAINIISPKYSFVNFNPANSTANCCIGENEVCLPVCAETDLIFQFNITTANIQDANDLMNNAVSDIQLLLLDVNGNLVHNWTATDNLLFERYRTGATQVTYLWRNTLLGLIGLIQYNQCFSFKIYASTAINSNIETKEAFSNCFILKSHDCFTSVLDYANNENYADFQYCNITNPINRVRLYMYLSQPKSIEDKAVYRKSNGVIRQTRSLITKEYTAQTEHFNELLHDKIVIALAHDLVNISTGNYNGGISKTGEYDIDWTDNICIAPAKFKVLATPYAIRNNNCADCQPVDLNIPACPLITNIQASVVNNNDGTETITITWNFLNPIVTQLHTAGYIAPATTGIPAFSDNISPNVPYVKTVPIGVYNIGFWSASLINECTFAGPAFINNVGIGAGGCIPVGIIGNPNLPNGTVGTAYNYSFNLSGDAPFALANINKPSWMNIAISGSSVVFSGTPNAIGTNIPVSFNITNCAGVNSVAFSDTLNISGAAQPGDITMDCNVGSQDPIPFGVAGTYNFYGMGITVNTPGTVILTAYNDQAGILNGYSMYKQQTVNITAGQTFIDFAVDYDGGGVHTIFEMFFSVTDLSGTQLCSGSFWSFI
jgi:hypothetical protein